MGTKQKLAKSGDNTTPNSVVVFNASSFSNALLIKKFLTLNLKLRLSLLAALVLVLVIGAYLLLHSPAQQPRPPLPAGIEDDFTSTELSNYPILLAHDYGLTEDDIMHGNLHKELKTFQEAYDIAIATARLGNKQRSLEAYKIAVSKAPKNIDASFYVEVMGESYQRGDKKYADEMYQKALAVTQHTPLPADQKAESLAHIKAVYNLMRQGADS